MSSEEFETKLEQIKDYIEILKINPDKETEEALFAACKDLKDMYQETLETNEVLDELEKDLKNIYDVNEKLKLRNQELSDKNQELITQNEELSYKLDQTDNKEKDSLIRKNMEIEGLNEKIKILQNSLDGYAKNLDIYERKINDLNNDNSNLRNKNHTNDDELEILKRNANKNFQLEKIIEGLNSENEKLSIQIKNQPDSETLKLKINKLECETKEQKENLEILTKQLDELKINYAKVSNENFDKFKVIVELENKDKLKNHKLEEFETEKKNLQKIISILENRIKELELNLVSSQSVFERQNKELKKEIDKVFKLNENLKKEVVDSEEKLKKIQVYTNFAKASKENFTKKDFSIQEALSRKNEELYSLNENLKSLMNEYSAENINLKTQNEDLQNILLYYINKEIGSIFSRSNFIKLSNDDIEMLTHFKDNPHALLNQIFTLKKDNIRIETQLQDITIECNQLLRESMKNKNKLDNSEKK